MKDYPFDEYFKYYRDLVKVEDPVQAMKASFEVNALMLKEISDEIGNHTYAEGKWSVKQLIMHIIDTERVFNYRAMCIARDGGDNLPGFDHDLFAEHRYHNVKPMAQILREYVTTRAASIELFSGFLDEEMEKVGSANGLKIDVETLAFLITGHEMHHMSVLSDKYLQAFA